MSGFFTLSVKYDDNSAFSTDPYFPKSLITLYKCFCMTLAILVPLYPRPEGRKGGEDDDCWRSHSRSRAVRFDSIREQASVGQRRGNALEDTNR